jgi:succinate dehydrogenase/fumarate reductase flavoprotein subunit
MQRSEFSQFDRETDVLVVGSGSAGMPAALAASTEGADVLVIEKAAKLGGTTAVSGGILWVPNSDPEVEKHGETPSEEVTAYIRRLAGDHVSEERIERFVETGPEAVHFVERNSPLEFGFTGLPDYHPEWEHGYARGRSIEPDVYDASRLGERKTHVRESPYYPIPATYRELRESGSPITPTTTKYQDRIEGDVWAMGRALIGGLYEACLERDVAFEREMPAEELIRDGERVCGVVATRDGERVRIGASAVVVACGGFPWNEQLRENFLRGPMTAPAAVPENEGDGVEMGMEIGAKLGNMNEAWWFPTGLDPAETWSDGSPRYRLVLSERTYPGSIVVNEAGERFCNEAGNYHDLGKRFHDFDQRTYGYANVPAYLICDGEFRDEYSLMTAGPEDPDPDWLASADSLSELAEAVGIDADGLRETVERFNSHAERGEDPDFHRGESAHDRKRGDRDAPHPNLAPLDTPPFYAMELHPGSIGTKGGLVTNADAAVLDVDEEIIPGLYAASNATAHVMGRGYPGSGGTLGPNLTFGYVAGLNAARES